MIEKGICMADGKTGAIILAAGRSAHMEELKPMLRMGQTTMIQREIDTIRQAGISPIVVVTGYQADVLERHISHRDAVCIRNKRYETSQMYGSICMGLRHIQKKADITVVCKELPSTEDVTRFGVLKMNEDCRIEEFEEKPMVSNSNIVSTGIYVIRRRQLIELVERCAQEDRYDFVKDILIRYKNLKRIYGYKMQDYWSNIAAVDSYYRTNMDFLKPEVRNYFFHQYPDIYSKVDDLPPAKYNPGSEVRNSLVSAGCIINGTVENSILFKKVFVGENCVIKNSIILNDVYLGDNTHIENCIVESRDTIRANSYHVGEDDIKIVIEKNERYVL